MKKSILRVKRKEHLHSIARKLGLDLTNIPRKPDREHEELWILQEIDEALVGVQLVDDDMDAMLHVIEEIPGIGSATISKIKAGLHMETVDDS